ncbi:hypothetical protein KVG95_16630 [Pseudomonas sp. SWRI79]|uniref:Uncharacterized protein n=1 Tax=Pseudomonas farris TaxID=2841207 RepID=A0ABS6PWU3_9PSED|nr:hypothetical protein [Pseudomonas farris]MBV4464952.1 hypothetical protein [Pseudomonas farris]
MPGPHKLIRDSAPAILFCMDAGQLRELRFAGDFQGGLLRTPVVICALLPWSSKVDESLVLALVGPLAFWSLKVRAVWRVEDG